MGAQELSNMGSFKKGAEARTLTQLGLSTPDGLFVSGRFSLIPRCASRLAISAVKVLEFSNTSSTALRRVVRSMSIGASAGREAVLGRFEIVVSVFFGFLKALRLKEKPPTPTLPTRWREPSQPSPQSGSNLSPLDGEGWGRVTHRTFCAPMINRQRSPCSSRPNSRANQRDQRPCLFSKPKNVATSNHQTTQRA